ncbi:ThiF family adenylyltransferase [bacterium]|nr:ThiF family adenylyltransferase [bacterium]
MGEGFSIKVRETRPGGPGAGGAPTTGETATAHAPSPEVGGAPVQAPAPERPQAIRIERESLVEDRYHRLRLIQWWDQERLASGVIVVAGAGALGNEAIKNLALLGVGRIFVCDLDTIETSNLTRSVLFRLGDVGRHKAEVACERAHEMNPDTTAIPVKGDLRFSLGLGLVRRADVILGCLDSVAARVYLNRHAFRMGKTFVDGGLDHLNGDVRTYVLPEGPCYECGLTEKDRTELKRKASCLKLTREDVKLGKVPTAPTIAAIAGGLQTQIAIRQIHGRPVPSGRRIGLYGLSDVTFDVKLGPSPECATHEWLECLADREVVELPTLKASESTLGDLLGAARKVLGPTAHLTLEDDRELIVGLTCGTCTRQRPAVALAGTLAEKDALCEGCGLPMRPDIRTRLDDALGLSDRTLASLGIPPLHIVRARDDASGREALLELTGDASEYFAGGTGARASCAPRTSNKGAEPPGPRSPCVERKESSQ